MGIRLNAAAVVVEGNREDGSQNRLWITTRALKSPEPVNRTETQGASFTLSDAKAPLNQVEILGWTYYAMHQASGEFTQLFMGMEGDQHTRGTFSTSEENWQSATVVPTDLPAVIKGKVFYRMHAVPASGDLEASGRTDVGEGEAPESSNVLVAEIPPSWVG